MDQKTEIRSYIKCRIRLNIDSKQIFNELCGIYGPQTISMRIVFRWIKAFKAGKFSVEGDTRPGSPTTSVTKANIYCFPTDRYKAVPLLQVFIFCASVVSYVVFVKSLFVLRLIFGCLGRVVLRDCAILSDFRTFVRFALVWFCLFPLPLGVW